MAEALPFGPRLIGQTEKALNAVLARELKPFGLSEPEWVTLQLAAGWDGAGRLAEHVARESHLAEADSVVTGLTARGLVNARGLTPAGAALRGEVRASIQANVAGIWDAVDPDDAAAAARALAFVRGRYEELLGAPTTVRSIPSSSLR